MAPNAFSQSRCRRYGLTRSSHCPNVATREKFVVGWTYRVSRPHPRCECRGADSRAACIDSELALSQPQPARDSDPRLFLCRFYVSGSQSPPASTVALHVPPPCISHGHRAARRGGRHGACRKHRRHRLQPCSGIGVQLEAQKAKPTCRRPSGSWQRRYGGKALPYYPQRDHT